MSSVLSLSGPCDNAIGNSRFPTDGWWRSLCWSFSKIDNDQGRAHELGQAAVKCMRGILNCWMKQAKKVEDSIVVAFARRNAFLGRSIQKWTVTQGCLALEIQRVRWQRGGRCRWSGSTADLCYLPVSSNISPNDHIESGGMQSSTTPVSARHLFLWLTEDYFLHGWSELRSTTRLLDRACLSHTGLRNMGTRKQIQY